MLYRLSLSISLVGASLAFPSLLSTKKNNVDITTMTNPDQIGTPTNQTGSQEPSNPGIGGVFMCHDVDWMNCTYTVFPLNTCFDMNETWNKSISSIGPDNGTMIMLFTETNCTGNPTQLAFPGSSNLMEEDNGMNDQFASINVLPAPANASSSGPQI